MELWRIMRLLVGFRFNLLIIIITHLRQGFGGLPLFDFDIDGKKTDPVGPVAIL